MRTDVKRALRGRSISFLGARREIRRLVDYLHDGEEVHDLLACNFGDTGGRALLVVTDERVIIYKDGWIFRNSQGMGYGDIRTIEVRTGLLWTRIKFKGEGMSFSANKVGRFSAEHGVKIIRGRIGSRYNAWEAHRLQLREQAANASMPTSPAPAPQDNNASVPFYQTDEPLSLDQFLTNNAKQEPSDKPVNLVDELERLQSLKDKGILSQEEHDLAKQKLLRS